MIEQVLQFHARFDLPMGGKDCLSGNDEATAFRLNFLAEELAELEEALEEGDRVKAFDALLDLAYVTYGTALFMGILPEQWNQGMDAVHKANMSKVRVASPAESKRKSSFDVSKPPGWVPPEGKLAEILSWTN